MKKALLVLALAVFSYSNIQAQETTAIPVEPSSVEPTVITAPTNSPFLEFGLQTWLSNAKGHWQIDFGSFFLSGRSKLEWDDIDAPVVILNAELHLTPELSFGGYVGAGKIDQGKNTDGDWLGNFQISESQADTDGDVKIADANVYYQIISTLVENHQVDISAFVGYMYYKDDLEDKNGIQTIVDEQPTYDPFAGLDSKYRFEWQMAKVGARGDVQITEKFSMRGSCAYLYLVDYKGEGYWNLRDDFRQSDPNFVQKTDNGDGVEAKLSGRYNINETIKLEIGYWFLMMNGKDGTDVTYFNDGTSDSTKFTEVETVRHGAFGSLLVAF